MHLYIRKAFPKNEALVKVNILGFKEITQTYSRKIKKMKMLITENFLGN